MTYQLFIETPISWGLGSINAYKSTFDVFASYAHIEWGFWQKVESRNAVGSAPRAHQAVRVRQALVGRGRPTLRRIRPVGAALPRPVVARNTGVAAEPLLQPLFRALR